MGLDSSRVCYGGTFYIAVQWLRLDSCSGSMGLIPSQGTKVQSASQCSRKMCYGVDSHCAQLGLSIPRTLF